MASELKIHFKVHSFYFLITPLAEIKFWVVAELVLHLWRLVDSSKGHGFCFVDASPLVEHEAQFLGLVGCRVHFKQLGASYLVVKRHADISDAAPYQILERIQACLLLVAASESEPL